MNVTFENTGLGFKPGIGATVERHLTKRSGFETGLYYRTFSFSGDIVYTDSTGSRYFPFTIAERHVSIPVLYKFYSRIVNFSAGPSFDFYTGWKQTNKNVAAKIENYTVSPALRIGVMAKVSKRFTLSEQFILEPEVRINPLLGSGRDYIGFGIAGKYKL